MTSLLRICSQLRIEASYTRQNTGGKAKDAKGCARLKNVADSPGVWTKSLIVGRTIIQHGAVVPFQHISAQVC